MTRRILKLLFFLALALTAVPFAQAQLDTPSFSFVDPQTGEKANAHEDELYEEGTKALHDEDYEDAAGKFDQVIRLHGHKVDAAIYWKAYALNKAGSKDQALTTIAELKKSYPQSRYLHDAEALEVEIKGASVNPNDLSDEETKLVALNALMMSDPERASSQITRSAHRDGRRVTPERVANSLLCMRTS